MSDKMTVLFVKDTGHVLASLTRASDPEAPLTPDVLAGDAFIVRYIGDPTASGYEESSFQFKPDQLDVLIPDLNAARLANPRGYFVDADKNVVPVNSVASVTPSFPSTGQIRVTVPSALTQESKVWVQIVDPTTSEMQIVTGKIAFAASQVDLNLSPLDSGTQYDVLALVQGFSPHRQFHSTP
jgi:hypothetical protein